MQKNDSKTAIRTSLTEFKEKEWLTNIPLYAIHAVQ